MYNKFPCGILNPSIVSLQIGLKVIHANSQKDSGFFSFGEDLNALLHFMKVYSREIFVRVIVINCFMIWS